MSQNVIAISDVEEKRGNYLAVSWLVWGLATAFFFFDYLARVAPGVMHHSLQDALGINEAGFGMLTASFYLPYVFMQIPVGLAVDRISIRIILTVMALITAIGCVVFGLANSLTTAAVARMLIGFSAAFGCVSALRLASTWFPPSMLGLLSGLTQAMGMLGAAAGEVPVSCLVANIGWRSSMLLIAVLFVILAGFLYQFIRDVPTNAHIAPIPRSDINVFRSLRIILTKRQSWLNALYAGFLFGPTAVIGEAIGPAYLQYGHNLSAHTAACVSGLIFVGWGISGPISGWLSDKIGRRKPLMIFSALSGVILTCFFVFYPTITPTMAYVVFFIFGVTNTGVAISYAIATELHESNVIGASLAFTNMISIFIGAMMQPLVGKLIDLVSGTRAYHVASLSLGDFQAGLKILPLSSLIALILALTIKETYCQPIRKI